MIRIIPCILLILTAFSLYSEENTMQYDEEKEAIFSTELADADVDFFIQGAYSLTLFASTGLIIRNSGGVQVIDTFPGMPMGFYFNQLPDITFSVWLMKKYFLEVLYQGNFDNNSFRAGYVGDKDEFIRHIYIGNKDIGLEPYRFLEIPQTGISSIGIEALFATENTSHNVLLRYDNNDQYEKMFIGQNEVIEIRLPPQQYARGQFLRLPDTDVENFVLYIQDPLGSIAGSDGFKYRKATSQEYIADFTRGSVFLNVPPTGRVLCYYTKGGIPVGDTAIGSGGLPEEDADGNIDETGSHDFDFLMGTFLNQDMSARQIVTDNNCLLLWEPNSFSPFENSSYYKLNTTLPREEWRLKLSAVYKQTWNEKTDFSRQVYFRRETELKEIGLENTISVYCNTTNTDYRNVYPFPDQDHILYGPSRIADDRGLDFEILVQIFNPIAVYTLDSDIIPDSVSVQINEVDENRFTVNYTSGIITFNRYIHPNDRIKVRYKKKGGSSGNGDLLFAWGNTFNLMEQLSLELATALRWNILPGSYTEKSFSRTGAIMGMAALKSSSDNHDLNLTTGFSYNHPDTTGIMRVVSMEKTGFMIDLSENNFYPAYPPSLPSAGYDSLNRGKIFYTDFREYDFIGNATLHNIYWSPPSGQVFPYSDNSKPGPYNVAEGSGSYSSSDLVIDYELDQVGGWVGVQCPIGRSYQLLDLSSYDSISLSFKTLDVTGSIRIYVQLGEIGEDLDEDMLLDRELTEMDQGFQFDDSAHSITLRVGGGPEQLGNYRIDSEDIDGNGFLDSESSTYLLSLTDPLLSFTGDITSFRNVTIDIPESMKNRISRTRALRILVVNEGGSASTGKVLINSISLSGSVLYPEITSGNNNGETLQIRETDEYMAKSPPAVRLESQFPIVATTFHSHGESQKVLEVEWNNLELPPFGDEGWKISDYNINAEQRGIYDTVSFFLRIPVLSVSGSENFAFDLTDYNGRGIHVDFTPVLSTAWQQISLDIKTGRLLINSVETAAAITIDPSYDVITRLSFEMTGSDSGLLYLDELYFTDPQGRFGFAAEFDGTYRHEEPFLSINGYPLLSGLQVKEKAYISTEGFSPLYGEGRADFSSNSLTELAINLMFIKTEINLLLKNYQSLFSGTAAHKLSVPKDPFYVVFTDAFNYSFDYYGQSFNRENTLTVYPDQSTPLFSLTTNAFLFNTLLVQSWQATLGYSWPDFIRTSSTIKLMQSVDGFYPYGEWYGDAWIRDYALVFPYTGGSPYERTVSLLFDFNLSPNPVGVDLNTSMNKKSSQFEAGLKKADSDIQYSLNVPVTIFNGKKRILTLSSGYRRAFSFNTTETAPGDYGRDAELYFSDLSSHPLFLLSLPFGELLADNTSMDFVDQTRDLTNAYYTPEFYTSLARDFGSRLYDLFLPSYCDLTFRREYKKQQDIYSQLKTLTFGLRNNAINLFGEFGAYSLFPFYALDEYMLGLTGSLYWDESGTLLKTQFVMDNYLYFETRNKYSFKIGNNLIITNEVYLDVMDKARISFDWSIKPEKGISLPLLDEKFTANAFISNSEILEGSFAYDNQNTSFHPATIIVTHKTGITFPEHGYITGLVSFGMDSESAVLGNAIDSYLRLGVRCGLEMKLTW